MSSSLDALSKNLDTEQIHQRQKIWFVKKKRCVWTTFDKLSYSELPPKSILFKVEWLWYKWWRLCSRSECVEHLQM